MTFFRRLFGLDFPNPAVGQVWRSAHSGRCMRVNDVHTLDSGSVFVYVEHEHESGRWTIADHYAIGFGQWRRRLRDERRELIAVDQPSPRYAPPPTDLLAAKAGCAAHGLAHPCEACAVESHCHPAMQQALAALEMAKAGLEWYRDAQSEHVNGSDDEAEEVISNAMQALREALCVKEDDK